MRSINFEVGNIKEYAINGDESRVIRLDVSDMGFAARFQTAITEIDEYQAALKDRQPTASLIAEMDEKARAIVDKAFGSPVCEIALGNVNCFSLAKNGKCVLQNFLEAFKPVIMQDFGAAANESVQKISKYTEGIDDIPAQPASDISALAALSPEQKRALVELLK